VKSGFLLDIVVRERTAIFQLLSSKYQALLVGWDSLLILDLCLNGFNAVRGLNLKGNSFTREGLDENLHLGRKNQQLSKNMRPH